MKMIVVFAIILIGVLGYFGVTLYNKIQISKALVLAAKPYEKITDDRTTTLLVLGDSTGVGVGAAVPEESVAGRLALYMQATYVENLSVSGAQVHELPLQIKSAALDHYSTILIQIGGNDIIRFHDAHETAKLLGSILDTLPRADQVIVMVPGNLGAATLIPWFVRPIYTNLNLKYHTEFEQVVTAHEGVYINLYRPPSEDPFVAHPEIYLAQDEFHPSSAGYEIWCNTLIANLKQNAD